MMFKNFTLFFLFLLLFTTTTDAQRTYIPSAPVDKSFDLNDPMAASLRGIMDTLIPGAFTDPCGNNVFNFTITDEWGFLAGTNGFGDLEKAQRFSFSGTDSYTVTESWIFFAEASVVGDGDVIVNIYSASNDGVPSTLLGSSTAIKASELNIDATSVVPTIFTYDTNPTVNTPQFFVSVDFTDSYAKNDTIGILISDDGCGDGQDSWELFADGTTWASLQTSWELDANLLIFTIVDFETTTSIDDPFITDKSLRMYPAVPNPAANHTDLRYELNASSQVSIEIYTADGRLMQKIEKGQQLPGQHQERIALDDFPMGQYIYGIVTDESRLMSKFVVGK